MSTTKTFLLVSILIWLVYAATLKFGFTELDDSIFYRDLADVFSSWSKAPGLFGRGVFAEHTDTYYRPLLMLSFLADQMISKSSVFYHTVNVLLHIISVCLLYLLLKRWMKELVALCITCVFAVHPLFVQVVAWIPGRNDSMLAIFVLGSILSIMKYLETKERKWWLCYVIFFTGGLFTKETAVVIPVVTVAIVFLLGYKKDVWLPVVLSVLPFLLWMWARNNAIQPTIKTGPNELIQAFMDNIGLSVQSLGKMLFPVNQSVFPTIEDTTYIYGTIVSVLLCAILFFSWKEKKVTPETWIGIIWLVVFLGPLLLVPREINAQAFEHRLYVPTMGLAISIGALLTSWEVGGNKKKWIGISLLIGAICIGLNLHHQQFFKNDITFWKQAVETSPNSSYAERMLGIKYYVRKKFDKSEKHISIALKLDSNERYANYYYGKLKLDQQKLELAEKYMLREDSLYPVFFDAVFDLARVYFEKGEMEKVPLFLKRAIEIRPTFIQAKNNLLVYYIKNNEEHKAIELIRQWEKDGTGVPPGFDNLK
jgi:hypothetical protein